MNFKKINKFRRNVRAISPVIATLLMIAIAVVASLVVYAWVMGYMGFTTTKTGRAIQIQSMTTTGHVYVQNVGDSAVTFGSANAVFVDGASVTYSFAGSSLDKGATIDIAITGGISVGQHTIKVTTTDGTFSQVTQTFS
jgi:flagellin-like protein